MMADDRTPFERIEESNSEVCPKGHVGRGILLDCDTIEGHDGGQVPRWKYECEVCGEVWWESEEL